MLLDGGRNSVLRQQFADGAVLAFRRGAVVAPDVEDQRVVAIAEPFDFIDDPADLDIDVLSEARRHFHQAALERLLVFGDAVPGRHRLMPRRELRVGGNPALLFGALENALAISVPAVIELTLILVRPLFHDVMRAMDRAARPIHEKRLIRLEGLVLVQPGDRVVRQVFAEMVAFLRRFWAGERTSCCEPGSVRIARPRQRGSHRNSRSRGSVGQFSNGPVGVVSSAGVLCHLPQAAVA